MVDSGPADTPESIVKPVCNASTPSLGELAIMAASQDDRNALKKGLNPTSNRTLYMSRLYFDRNDSRQPAVAGPIMGAPYAVMLLEILHAWGVGKAIFWGWCGAIDETYETGDVIVPSGAFVDEGTSLQYGRSLEDFVPADKVLSDLMRTRLKSDGVAVKSGPVWTTDAIFRETPQRMHHFLEKGACAVEMEFSALCSAAALLGIALAGVLVVSDELFTGQWNPGFRNTRFLKSRKIVASVLSTFHNHQ